MKTQSLLPEVEPKENLIGFTPSKIRFSEMIEIVESPSTKPRTNFEERFRLCLPYCLQRGDDYGKPEKSLLLNRHYQPLGVRYRAYDYWEYPCAWWIKTSLLDSIIPRRLLDDTRRVVSRRPKIIPANWTYDSIGYLYDDGWAFTSKSSPDYRRYHETAIVPIQSALKNLLFVAAIPDFTELKKHSFSSWSYHKKN